MAKLRLFRSRISDDRDYIERLDDMYDDLMTEEAHRLKRQHFAKQNFHY